MDKGEIKKQFKTMEIAAKKLIDTGENKAGFMFGISDAASRMASENLCNADYIVKEAQKSIERIAKYRKR